MNTSLPWPLPQDLPDTVEVVIEIPMGAFAKRSPAGRVEYLSPVPCPFNYGSISNTVSADGEPLDAVVLGPRLERGDRSHWLVLGIIHFEDAGVPDSKIVVGTTAIGSFRRRQLIAFFRLYGAVKSLVNTVLRRGRSRYVRWIPKA